MSQRPSTAGGGAGWQPGGDNVLPGPHHSQAGTHTLTGMHIPTSLAGNNNFEGLYRTAAESNDITFRKTHLIKSVRALGTTVGAGGGW